LNFREATLFIDWIQQAVGQLGKDAQLAAVPKSLGGVAREWTGVIDRLNQQFLESEEDRTDTHRNLQSAKIMVDSLTKELGTIKVEFESSQKTCTGLEQQIKKLEASLSDFDQVSKERDQLVSKVSTMQSALQDKGAELESVSMTLKSLSNAIRNLLPSDPS
jgi:ABC-type transporter Mla subunit MlaD